ncbi:hypothetical protein QJS10_CPA03g00547 [Acorus calamus]|uniref:SAM domain-containing protein n=1 Tax=Acorus calamus TaxID=4465 RepID=A0AAV9F5X3_ACOCL|nr:hypothetical protein QJS10_CPA03g00547 [Acorus calamus]
MVMAEATEREPPQPPTAAESADDPPRREPKTLHNFAISDLKWGNQRLLRCVKAHRTTGRHDRRSAGGRSDTAGAGRRHLASSSSSSASTYTSPLQAKFRPTAATSIGTPEVDDLAEIRAKLLCHLERAAENMKRLSLSEDVVVSAAAAAVNDGGGVATTPSKPWNLRTRRTACKGNPRPPSLPPAAPAENQHLPWSLRLRGLAAASGGGSEAVGEAKKERARFSVSLTREEIEEDVFGLTGSKPSRRPKKRPKFVRKQLDLIFPGLWLTEVTPEIYKVSDVPNPCERYTSTPSIPLVFTEDLRRLIDGFFLAERMNERRMLQGAGNKRSVKDRLGSSSYNPTPDVDPETSLKRQRQSSLKWSNPSLDDKLEVKRVISKDLGATPSQKKIPRTSKNSVIGVTNVDRKAVQLPSILPKNVSTSGVGDAKPRPGKDIISGKKPITPSVSAPSTHKQKIQTGVDMFALKHMDDSDLKQMGLPMGPRKKILLGLSSLKSQTSKS